MQWKSFQPRRLRLTRVATAADEFRVTISVPEKEQKVVRRLRAEQTNINAVGPLTIPTANFHCHRDRSVIWQVRPRRPDHFSSNGLTARVSRTISDYRLFQPERATCPQKKHPITPWLRSGSLGAYATTSAYIEYSRRRQATRFSSKSRPHFSLHPGIHRTRTATGFSRGEPALFAQIIHSTGERGSGCYAQRTPVRMQLLRCSPSGTL